MSRVVAAARSWLGTPYVHGASVQGGGTDCLGLIRGVWRDLFGCEPEEIPTYTPDWSEPQGDEALLRAAERMLEAVPSRRPLMVGEVLLFRMRDAGVAKHLGILSQGPDSPRFIHAYSGRGVVESSLSLPWARRIAGRYQFPKEG